MRPEGRRSAGILLVEDNHGDARLIADLLEERGCDAELSVVTNGDDAIAFLRGTGRFAGAARPELVLLDINLPRKNGFEVLQEIKGDPSLRPLPVVVITSSDAPADVQRAYELQASSYIVKPPDLPGWERLIAVLDAYWLDLCRLPPKRADGP